MLGYSTSSGMQKGVYDPAAIAQQVVGTTATQTLTHKTFDATSPTAFLPQTSTTANGSSTTGWAATPTVNVQYIQIGIVVILTFSITGTSNATTATLTLPIAAANFTNIYYESTLALTSDTGVNYSTPGKTFVAPGTSNTTCNFYKDETGLGWTASGTKAVRGTLIYLTA